MRLLRRRRSVAVRRFDAATGRWVDVDAASAVNLDGLTVATFNIWFDSHHAEQRYLATAEILRELAPDVVALQEVTPAALDIFLSRQWVRDEYLHASVVGGDTGNYGMLMLSRIPLARVTYTRLPTRQSRGFLEAELAVGGGRQVVCCLHLDSGKSSARLRGWQLRRIFRALTSAESAVLLGDFNMRDAEDERITAPYCDVWPASEAGRCRLHRGHVDQSHAPGREEQEETRALRPRATQGHPLARSGYRAVGHEADLT